MTLTIELPPELEHRLEEEAARRGQAPAEFVTAVVAEKLGVPPAMAVPEEVLYAGLPRRDPAELVELARMQGVKPLDFDELMQADFWPEEESVDESPASR